MEKEYIGDGVYIEHDAHRNIILTVSNGMVNTATIYLEPGMVDQIVAYRDRVTPKQSV